MRNSSQTYPSIFNDVIGPVMRGPSSSHCAAAVRIGKMVRDLMDGEIKAVLIEREKDVKPLTNAETNKLFVEEKTKCLKRRRGSDCVTGVTVNKKTVEKAKKEMSVRNRKAQHLTTARIKAMKDIRVSYKTAVGYVAYADRLPPENKYNAVCTTFIVKQQNAGGYYCVVREKGESHEQVTMNCTSDLDLLVK